MNSSRVQFAAATRCMLAVLFVFTCLGDEGSFVPQKKRGLATFHQALLCAAPQGSSQQLYFAFVLSLHKGLHMLYQHIHMLFLWVSE